MLLNAEFLTGDVIESTFYDQGTGAPKIQWVLEMAVMDVETDEKYTVQIAEGLPLLDELKDRKRKGDSEEVLRQIVDEIRGQLPARNTPMQLQVLRFKGKQVAFLKLVCRLVGVAAAV